MTSDFDWENTSELPVLPWRVGWLVRFRDPHGYGHGCILEVRRTIDGNGTSLYLGSVDMHVRGRDGACRPFLEGMLVPSADVTDIIL